MFEHEFWPRTELQNHDTQWGRYYECPVGKLPSVTTVLKFSNWFDHSSLDKWKKRVGPVEAARVSGSALTKGRELHDAAEKFLLNQEDWNKGIMPGTAFNFRMLRKNLERNVAVVHGIEFPLYSNRLKTAGKADMICRWGGYDDAKMCGPMAVVDFKTSKREKKEEDILSYFVQASTYALMFEEMFKTPPIEDIVILIIVDMEQVQTFHRQTKDYRHIIDALFPMKEFR